MSHSVTRKNNNNNNGGGGNGALHHARDVAHLVVREDKVRQGFTVARLLQFRVHQPHDVAMLYASMRANFIFDSGSMLWDLNQDAFLQRKRTYR